MSTKKIILIIAGVVGVLALIVAIVAGGILWFSFHKINNSEAADTARTFLRNNEILKRDIGEVKDFGSFIPFNISAQNTDGEATLHITVMGEKRTVKTTVQLSYRSNRSWRVTGATYDRDGQTIDLVQGYGPPSAEASPSN